MRINHPPYYYLSEVETNVVQRSLEPFSRELFANQFLCNAASNLKASLLCRTMHCENLPTHSCLLISAVQDPPPTLALNTGQNQFNALLYYAFSAEYCKAVCWKKDFKPVCSHTVFHILWSPPPLIAKKKTILCKPSHMWRSSMQKRWSGNQNAVQYLMQRCALQTPSRWNKNKKSGETKKRFLQKLETCSCSEESTPCVPNSDLSHKMSLWNKLFNLNVASWRPSFDFWSLELNMAMNGGERKDNEKKKVSGASLVELSL